MAESREDRLHRYLSMAQELENASANSARRRRIERREKMYRQDWAHPQNDGKRYLVDPMPFVTGTRAQDKICSQPYQLVCRSELPDVTPFVEMGMAPNDRDLQVMLQDAARGARKRADLIEANARGLLRKIESQQGVNVLRLLARNAAVPAYAGPLRIGFDPDAAAEAGVLPLFIQALDPRSYYEVPGTGAANGPKMVIYTRRARRATLESEGWGFSDKGQRTLDKLEPETQITIYDVWEKVRKPAKRAKATAPAAPLDPEMGVGELDSMGAALEPADAPLPDVPTGPTVELWHCIIADGGELNREFLKPPTDMAKSFGLTRIPYVYRPVRPSAFAMDEYPGHDATGFLDVYFANWEERCWLLSASLQLMDKAVNPPTVGKTREGVDVQADIPGAHHDIRPDESIELLLPRTPLDYVNQSWQLLEQLTQRGTFSAPSYGEGANSMSGLMTGRLQQAGEEALGSTIFAVESALADLFGILALMASIYLRDGSYVVPTRGLESAPLDAGLFAGTEIFEVKLPAMTPMELAQQAAIWMQLSAPRPDGSKFLSDSTAREQSRSIPYEHEEAEKIRGEQFSMVKLEAIKVGQVEAATAREESAKNMQAEAVSQVNAERAAQASQQQMMEREVGVPQGAPPLPSDGRPDSPAQPTAPTPPPVWAPAQPMRGVG